MQNADHSNQFCVCQHDSMYACAFFANILRSKYEKAVAAAAITTTASMIEKQENYSTLLVNVIRNQHQRLQIINHPMCNSINIFPCANHSLGVIEFIYYKSMDCILPALIMFIFVLKIKWKI